MKHWRPEVGWPVKKNLTMLKLEQESYPARRAYEAGADAILEELEKKGIKGEVKACPIPAMVQDEISFDDFDTVFISEDEKLEIYLNGAEDMVYGKQACHIITPVKGHLTFIPEKEDK